MNKDKWITWGVTTIGPSHERSGLPNQDFWSSETFEWGDVVVVADGLGSLPKSDLGSRAICRSVIEASKIFFKSKTNNIENIRIEDFLRLINAIWLAEISPHRSRECSSTCLFAILNGDMILLGQLGDGLIIASSNNSNGKILNESKEDSFSNVTYSIRSNFQFEQWRYAFLNASDYKSVLLCTDGISDDLVPGTEHEFAKRIYEEYNDNIPRKRYYKILDWLKNWPTPRHSDDKTIACLNKVNAKTYFMNYFLNKVNIDD